jgi:hypothetical protein
VPLQVTRDTILPVQESRRVRNGYRLGNQSQLLVRDRHSDAYDAASLYERYKMRLRARGVEPISVRQLAIRARSYWLRSSQNGNLG